MLVAAVDAANVAAARAVTQQAHILVVMRRRQVVVRMAPGAVRLVSREWPGDDLVVGPVAVDTQHRRLVVARIIRRVVPEQVQWCPDRGPVAAVAVQCGHKMRRRLARGDRAVVAAQAKAGDHCVIKSRRDPCGREMTAVAFGRGRQVGRVFACGSDAVVTGGAGLGDCRMVKSGGDP